MSNDIDNLILYFTASWCDPCKTTRPLVDQINLDQTFVKFFIIDADDATQMLNDFGVETVPTFILIKNGAEISRTTNKKSKKELEEMVNNYKQ